jgi:diketogulonate reductase-like aldo/keto reductase
MTHPRKGTVATYGPADTATATPLLTRAQVLRLGAGLAGLAALPAPFAFAEEIMQTRPIPSSGQPLPVIGLGTWQGFDVGTGADERKPLSDVLAALYTAGGSVVDSSPMYGRSEGVAGDLIEASGARPKTFIATKVWTRGKAEGIAQMEQSMALLKSGKTIDLMQVHNLVDYKTHLDTLRGWKMDGRVKYIGVTHYTPSAFAELEAVLRAEPLDFVQLNYAVNDRAAEKTLLPLAKDKGIAVLVNRPFGGGGTLRGLKGKPLPDFAAEIGCTSWAQVLLKFILAHPAVTCAIPGTAKPQHMADNVKAGMGAPPDGTMREKIAAATA